MSHSLLALQPRHGDVVLTRPSASVVSYSVRELAGGIRFTVSSKDEAVRLARGLAQRQAVDLWYCEGERCLLLECYGRGDRSRSGETRMAS